MAAQRRRLETYVKEHGFDVIGCSNDIRSGLTFDRRPGLLEFHNKAVDEDVDILLACDLSRLSRDLDRTLQYWYLLRDLDVGIHTAKSGEVDWSIYAMSYGIDRNEKSLGLRHKGWLARKNPINLKILLFCAWIYKSLRL